MKPKVSISKHKPVYVYLLKCADNSYYTGITNHLERRIKEHQKGQYKTDYTFSRRPVELMFFDYFSNAANGIDFEKRIKGWSRKKKEALIERNWDKVREFAECQNESHFKNKDN